MVNIHRKKYSRERNTLIPIAEKFANKQYGSVGPSSAEPKKRDDWVKNWNIAFLGKMDELYKVKYGSK